MSDIKAKLEALGKPYTTVSSQKITFANKNLKPIIGQVEAGEYLGDFLRKEKHPTSDSFFWFFKYPHDNRSSLVPNQNRAPFSQDIEYCFLAELDEVQTVTPKLVGTTPIKALDKAADATGYIGATLKLLVGIAIAYLIINILISRR